MTPEGGQKRPPVVLSAPSGAGKTTIAKALVERDPGFLFSISATTRPLRGREVHGEDYLFLSREEFQEMIRRGEFAEWAEVHGQLYGTPLSSLIAKGGTEAQLLLDIDVQGAMQIRETVPQALLLFILPPSVEALLSRLQGRGTEGTEAIRRRLTTALEELEAAEGFEYFVINNDLEEAIQAVRSLATTGKAPPDGCFGDLHDVRKLRIGIQTLLSDDPLSDSY